MKKIISPFSLALVVFFGSSAAFAEKCSYSVDPSTVQVGWTAFKTTQKVAVSASFPGAKVSGSLQGQKSLQKLLQGLMAEIKLDGALAIKTGNPARDQTLFDHFFNHFKKTPVIQGRFRKSKGDDQVGEVALELVMNETKKSIPMQYSMDEKGAFQASGSLDVLDFGLATAFDDLHKTCETLHKGADGISKTWSTVDLKIQATIIRACK